MSTRSHISVRLDEKIMARVDALGPLFSTRWRRATRSDILRALLLSAMPALEEAPVRRRRRKRRKLGASPGKAKMSG